MSFDLFFFKAKDATISLNDVINFFRTKTNIAIKPIEDDNYKFEYFDYKTSIKFSFQYNVKDELETDLTFDDRYTYCYTSFTLSYLRPAFFALAAMPIVEDFSKTFNLLVNDTQSQTEEKNALKIYTAAELIDSYQKNNDIAIAEFSSQFPLPLTERAKSLYYFRYLKAMPDLKENYDLVIPVISFLKNINDNKVYSVFSWNNAAPTIVPKCDFVLTLTNKKALFFKKQQASLVPYELITRRFDSYLKKADSEVTDLLMLTDTDSEDVKERFTSLPQNSTDEYSFIENDEFTDQEQQ